MNKLRMAGNIFAVIVLLIAACAIAALIGFPLRMISGFAHFLGWSLTEVSKAIGWVKSVVYYKAIVPILDVAERLCKHGNHS